MTMDNNDKNVDQFKLLEDKIDNLIQALSALKKEKVSLVERFELQKTKNDELINQVELFKGDKDKTRQKISSILEKIDRIEL